MTKKGLRQEQLQSRKDNVRYFYFVFGIDLFSRYAFVQLNDKNSYQEFQGQIQDMPLVDREAFLQQQKLFNKRFSISSDVVIETFTNWFKKIDDMGYIVSNIVSDNGVEFVNSIVKDFLQNGGYGIFNNRIEELNTKLRQDGLPPLTLPVPIHSVLSVPNDNVANPVVERFIGTFKRLAGQYLSSTKKRYLLQSDVDKIVDYYNNRIHSSTGYAPIDIVSDNDDKTLEFQNQDTLFELYRNQKNEMYNLPFFEGDNFPLNAVCRIYTKWNMSNLNVGDKKSNIHNWSYSLYKIVKFNKQDNAYILSLLNRKDNRDFAVMSPPDKGLRREFLKVIDFPAFQKYNTTF